MSAPKKPRSPRKPKAPKLTPEQKETRRWERAAERELLRAIKKSPVLVASGLITFPTPAEKRARHEAYLAQRDLDEQRRAAELASAIATARDAFAAEATVEQLASFEERLPKYPALLHASMYLDALREVRGLPEPVSTYKSDLAANRTRGREERKRLRQLQPVLFAEELGIKPVVETPACAVVVDDGPAPPCPDCGWDRTISSSKLAFNLHPPTCPSLLGFLLGMARNCAACKALRYGCCPACRAAVVACNESGHLPHWPTKGFRSLTGHPYCERCDVILPVDAIPQQAA